MSFTDPTYITPLIINNNPTTTSKSFPVVSPSNPTINLWNSSSATLSDVEAITAAASAAFPSWAATKLPQRRELILKAAELLETKSDDLRQCLALESGADKSWVDYNCKVGIDLSHHVAGELAGGTSGSVPAIAAPGRSAFRVKEPLGVILAVIPWNAPVVLLLRGILYALAAGNTVIVKSSELSPRTHFILTSLIISAGFPPGVINLISHSRADAPEVTAALISHRAVRKISFTGSAAIGRRIAALAGEHLKPVVMELGGKAPFIVCEDADIQGAAKAAAFGAFVYAGQVCMSTEKIILHSSVVEAFTDALVAASAEYGASQMLLVPDGPRRVKALVDSAVAAGAKIVNRGAYDGFVFENNREFPNLILKDVTDKMDLYHQESFGPVVSVFVVDSDEEAIRIGNDTDYGLVSAVWTKDLRRALGIGRRIQAGLVSINGPTVAWEPSLGGDGFKDSGYGRHSLDEFLNEKVMIYDL